MSQWPPGGGYPYPPQTNPYMSGPPTSQGADPNLLQSLAETQRQLAELISLTKTASQYPSQWRAGIIEWPDRYPFPMVLTQELLTDTQASYGTTNVTCRANMLMDVTNPTYITAISFNLWRPVVDGNNGLQGVWLPLGGTRQPFVAAGALGDYTGRDFQWRVQTASNDILWQTGWRTSDQCNGDERKGYILPAEYEVRRNDVVSVEVQPIGAVPDPAETFRLEVVLHVYKMLLRQ